jgi:hypothetical protein
MSVRKRYSRKNRQTKRNKQHKKGFKLHRKIRGGDGDAEEPQEEKKSFICSIPFLGSLFCPKKNESPKPDEEPANNTPPPETAQPSDASKNGSTDTKPNLENSKSETIPSDKTQPPATTVGGRKRRTKKSKK